MRRAPKRDAGEAAIIESLRAVGATVLMLDNSGAPDLCVGFRGTNYLFEVKQPIGPKGGTSQDGQQLSERQLKWHRAWRGSVDVIRSPQEALLAIHAISPDELCPEPVRQADVALPGLPRGSGID